MKKKRVAYELPHVVGPHLFFVYDTSYITNGQFSPVDRTKIRISELWKLLKFLNSGSIYSSW